jgi:hypothetical protein
MSVEQDFELCTAVGVASADMTEFDAFLLSAKVMQDHAVWQKRMAMANWPPAVGKVCGPLPDVLDAIEDMSAAERNALRNRILPSRG